MIEKVLVPQTLVDRDFLKDQYFDLKGLSVYASLSVSTLRNHIRGGLPYFSVCGKILVKRSEFDAWISQYRGNKNKDIDGLVDEVIDEVIGEGSRRSHKTSN